MGWEDPLEERLATHSRILAWRVPMDRGAWWATVDEVAVRYDWVTKHSIAQGCWQNPVPYRLEPSPHFLSSAPLKSLYVSLWTLEPTRGHWFFSHLESLTSCYQNSSEQHPHYPEIHYLHYICYVLSAMNCNTFTGSRDLGVNFFMGTFCLPQPTFYKNQ